MTLGTLYLKLKKHWRAWLKMFYLKTFEGYYLTIPQNINEEIIISFTTIPSRISSTEFMLRSILAGRHLPKVFLMNVDIKTSRLLKDNRFLNALVERGLLEVNIVEDLKSYKKLVYSMKKYPNHNIVICDDDVLYPKNWFKSFSDYQVGNRDLKKIVCHRGHNVKLNQNGQLESYKTWDFDVTTPSRITTMLFPTGTGGVYYPKNSLPPVAFNSHLFTKFAPHADDIWFWLSAISNNCHFGLLNNKVNYRDMYEIPDSQTFNLWSTNVNESKNDTQLRKSLKYFFESNLINESNTYYSLLYPTYNKIKDDSFYHIS